MTLWLLRERHGDVLLLQSLELVEQIDLDMTISVERSIAEYLRDKSEINTDDMANALEWLRSRFIVPEGEDGDRGALGLVFLGRFENDNAEGFELYGQGWRAVVRRHENRLRLERITRFKSMNVRLASARGSIKFADASVEAVLQQPEQRARLDAALRDNGSYLQLWEEYGRLEWERAKSRAGRLGALRYVEASQVEGERKVWFLRVPNPEHLKAFRERWRTLEIPQGAHLEVAENAPDFYGESDEFAAGGDVRQRRRLRGAVEFQRDGLTLIPNQDRRSESPPPKGYVYYSLAGEAAIQTRRDRAKQSINSGRRLPQLTYLLEGIAPPTSRRRHYDGLSPYARQCFKGPPTDRQKQALDVAINTPDIALIVGPPGTGKTQVIAALQRRLAETMGDSTLQHQVLISSYQHTAVDNALNRAEVFGLPAVRVGGKDVLIDPVKNWCKRKRSEMAARLDALEAEDPLVPLLDQLSKELAFLRLTRLLPEERLIELRKIDELVTRVEDLGVLIAPKVGDRWAEFLARQSAIVVPGGKAHAIELLRIVRSQRSTRQSYLDDGPDRAHQLKRALRRGGLSLAPQQESLLESLADTIEPSEEQLAELETLKSSLIDRLRPDYRPPELKRALDGETLDILAEMENAIEGPVRKTRRGKAFVISAYHAALGQAQDRSAQAVREYASIVGATCQQSAGADMTRLKGGSLREISALDASLDIEFDTVVIDEAARANPLDLFVPMAMARKRIVLVGDHRQLPHLVQRELEDELITKQSLSELQAKAYEQSLFERLVRQLKEQEGADSVRRVVMLDTQYRMHPDLGDFISQQFYESEGLGVLHSGRPASDFAHEYPGYEGKCCAWIDVPISEGKESRAGTSRIRHAEAKAIAKEVRRLSDACGRAVSIGVITFYRAQCDAILDAFVDEGLAEREEGDLKIARDYRETDAGDERLLVGTVDAFQGKEFDVVFLSIVRSNAQPISERGEPAERERMMNAKYGHLRVSNRLNVAMSRQRKLLIAVGDRAMAEGREADEAIAALAAFQRLCRNYGRNGN